MTTYLSMNGTSDHLNIPSLTFTQIVMDVNVISNYDSNQHRIWSLPYGANYLMRATNQTDTYSSGVTSVLVNGTQVTNNTAFIPVNSRCTITSNSSNTNSIYIFSNNGTGSFVQGNIYDIKFYNGATLVAHYDMSTGTVNDQTGNGYNATLTGGTWVGGSTTYIGSGTSQGTSSVTSNETLILTNSEHANGTSSLTTSETVISQSGTTYSESGTSNGLVSLTTTESKINSVNGNVNATSSLSSTEIKSYSANGSTSSKSNVSSVDNVIYVDFGNSNGQSNLTTSEQLVTPTGTTYAESGQSNGLSSVTSNDKVTFESSEITNGNSTLTTTEHETLSAQGNVTAQASATSSETFVGHPTTTYSASGVTDGYSDVLTTEQIIFEVVSTITNQSNLLSTNTVDYFVGGLSNGETFIVTTEKYISKYQLIGSIKLTGIRELNIYLPRSTQQNINMKGMVP